ncbi:hypothetical protein D3C72_251820 [compost metagenome]
MKFAIALLAAALVVPVAATPAAAYNSGATTAIWGKTFLGPNNQGQTPLLLGTMIQTKSIAPFYLGGGGYWSNQADGSPAMGYGGMVLGSSYIIGGNTLYDLRLLFGGGNILNGRGGFLVEPSLGYGLEFGKNVLSINVGYLYSPNEPATSGATLGLRVDFFKLPVSL